MAILSTPARTLIANPEFSRLPPEAQVIKTAQSLEANGMSTMIVEDGRQARARVLDLIPAGAQVYNPPSRTLEQIGLAGEIESSTRFQPVRTRLQELDRVRDRREIRKLVGNPEVVVGSVHAVTEGGQVLIASATGSQLGSIVLGAETVIWVVGIQKLVPTLEDGLRRIREYSYPLENDRTQQVYGRPSAVNKILIMNREVPGRISIILVKQNLGF